MNSALGSMKASDQPGAGYAIDLRVFSRYPLARGSPDVAACRPSLFGPISNTAFQEVRFHSHEAQCSGHALANFASVNAVGDDLAPARQISSPLFDMVRRAMKRIGQKRIGAGKISIAPHVDYDRRRFGAKPCIKGIWGYRVFTVVHAQSPRRIERCAELGQAPSNGESAFPRGSF